MRDPRHTLRKLALLFGLCALLVGFVGALPREERRSPEAEAALTLEMARLNAERGAGVPVQPLLPIETVWDLEDTRAPAEAPLVEWMENGGGALGFDRESGTFYCPIGSGLDAWPQLSLTAGGAEGLSVAFVDDYEWDAPADAVREGTAYSVIAWTETAYQYGFLVFTGLPVVTLAVTEYDALTEERDMAARCTVAAPDYEPLALPARVHLRSGGFAKEYDKWSYRVEFQERTAKGRYRGAAASVLGMEADTDWLLISNASDKVVVRNHMGFDLWNRFFPAGDGIAMLQSRLVEVFVQDQYMGMYQLMQRVDPVKEIARLGGNLGTDGVCRVIKPENLGRRPTINLLDTCGFIIEMRQTPKGDLASGLAIFGDFIRLQKTRRAPDVLSDAEFAALAPERVDTEQLMAFFLFMQAAGLPYDNVVNNVYIYGTREDGHPVYRFSPWDMDMGFQQLFPKERDNLNEWMELPVRMLNLNLGGTREALWRLFEEKRETILSDDALYAWFLETEEMVNASGAFRRDSLKWRGEDAELSLAQQMEFTVEHMKTIERYLNESWLPDGREKKTDL